MEMEATETDAVPFCGEADRSIRENKLTAMSPRCGISPGFSTHQGVVRFFGGEYLNGKSWNLKELRSEEEIEDTS